MKPFDPLTNWGHSVTNEGEESDTWGKRATQVILKWAMTLANGEMTAEGLEESAVVATLFYRWGVREEHRTDSPQGWSNGRSAHRTTREAIEAELRFQIAYAEEEVRREEAKQTELSLQARQTAQLRDLRMEADQVELRRMDI